ncbi:MAG: GGDEF domain-containing protein, partial [Pseudomonadota bacterium]
AIWDIDFFKRVNDSYGHQAGDRLLAAVARLLSDSTRVEDFVARLGGEEFVVLFPATDLAAARPLVERLREKIAAAKFHFRGSPLPVTVSCGLTEFRAGDTPTAVYERADKALYEAKSAGRNRCAEA